MELSGGSRFFLHQGTLDQQEMDSGSSSGSVASAIVGKVGFPPSKEITRQLHIIVFQRPARNYRAGKKQWAPYSSVILATIQNLGSPKRIVPKSGNLNSDFDE